MTVTPLPRLSGAALNRLPPNIGRPVYDREAVHNGIVHLGIGAFHRAHQAVYTEAVLASGDMRWGILGASLRSPDTRAALTPQQGLYTVAVRDNVGERYAVVGSVQRVLVAPEDPGSLIAALCDPAVGIVSLTVTEKGYYRDPATGDLDENNLDIVHDLAEPRAPRTSLGFIVEAISRRRFAGLPAFTVVPCDNLPANGRTLHRLLRQFSERRQPELARFIENEIYCPSTMVDRIVPATVADDRNAVAAKLGLWDAWPVVAEPFSQWVIEEAFGGIRPGWEVGGAAFVSDVGPYELMKLRLLNGAHSTIAYLGWLAGHDTVADTIESPGFAPLIRGMMDEEITPTLPMLPGFDLNAYKNALIGRFRNSALHHRTVQIAMDGSQKIPQRLLAPIRDRLQAGAPIQRLTLAVAAWMRYVSGLDEQDRRFEVQDPLSVELRRRTEGASTAGAIVHNLLDLRAIFGDDLPRVSAFRVQVEKHLSDLLAQGAALTVASFEANRPGKT